MIFILALLCFIRLFHAKPSALHSGHAHGFSAPQMLRRNRFIALFRNFNRANRAQIGPRHAERPHLRHSVRTLFGSLAAGMELYLFHGFRLRQARQLKRHRNPRHHCGCAKRQQKNSDILRRLPQRSQQQPCAQDADRADARKSAVHEQQCAAQRAIRQIRPITPPGPKPGITASPINSVNPTAKSAAAIQSSPG